MVMHEEGLCVVLSTEGQRWAALDKYVEMSDLKDHLLLQTHDLLADVMYEELHWLQSQSHCCVNFMGITLSFWTIWTVSLLIN